MIQKVIIAVEWLFAMMMLVVNWGILPGYIMSFCGTWYFIAMIKINVIDKEYGGSWKKYFKTKLKLK